MKYTKPMLLGTAVVAISSIVAGCAAIGIGGTPDERWADYKSWTKVIDGETGDPTKFIGNVHLGPTGFRNVYVNSTGLDTTNTADAGRTYPLGSVLLKEQYKSQANWEAGKNPSITVAVKVAEGPGAASWAWAEKFTGDAGESAFCSGCHTIAAKHDYMFTGGGYAK